MKKCVKKITWKKIDSNPSKGDCYIGKICDCRIAFIEELACGCAMDGKWSMQMGFGPKPVEYCLSLDGAKRLAQETFNDFIKSSIIKDTDVSDEPSIILIKDVDSLIEKHGKDFVLDILTGKSITPSI